MKIQPSEAGCDPCFRRGPDLRGLLWLGLWLWLAIFLVGPAAASPSTPLPPLERADISKAWRVCTVPTQSTLEQVLAGDCLRVSEPATRTAWGFDPRAFWMQVVLVNTSAQPSQRLLTIGHARLQEVSLFEVRGDQMVSRHDSGISVPLADKPLAMARPAFELRFEPGEQKSLWLRVASQTTIDLKTELWSPREAYLVEQRLQFFETLALGLMLLCMLYSLGSFLLQREKLMLYFSGFMAAEFIVELCRSGLMQLYLWPVHWAFDARILGTAVALSLVSFTLLLRAFLHPIQRFPLMYKLYMLMVCLSLAGIGWSWLVDYRQGTQWWTATIPLTSASVAALALLAGHRGQSSAKLLLQSFAVMLLIESVRIFSVLGWIETIDIGVLITPWAIALATSFILINMNQRSVEVQAALAKSQLESAARLQFMSQMSHELRSPLTTMLGHLQLMKHEPLAPPVRGGIQAIWRDARQLLAMIDDILDYAKGSLGHKGLHPLPRRWGQLIKHIGQSASALAKTHGHPLVLTVTGASDAALMVDERRLQQVLNNLLTNAARYAQQGEIQLTCALEPSQDTDPGWAWRMNFSVSDRGEGIALQDQERIFEPFQRGPKAHLSSHKGIGMGLAIARQLVQNMGGAMHLKSQPGQGSCFSFHVLCAAALPEDFENLEQDPAMAPGLDDEWQSDNTVAPAQTLEQPEVLARPDEASLAVPRQLVANGQLSDLLDWATALEKASPGLTAYCQRVRQAAMELDMPMLQFLCAVSAPYPSSVPPPLQPATAP